MDTPTNTSFYLVLDQGTSSTKVFLFDANQNVRFTDRSKHRLHRPAENHVESNPVAIVETCFKLIKRAWEYSRQQPGQIIAAGLAVQRSTFLFWDKETIKPLTPAISWQDSRAKSETDEFQEYAQWIQNVTGTPLSAHFGAPKFRHLIRKNPDLLRRVQAGAVWFGPLSAFITHSLTGKVQVDETIAGRSLLMDLKTVSWDTELCSLFGVPETCLPRLKPPAGDFGSIEFDDVSLPLRCVIGDQQAALLGQGGWEEGATAMNFGTSGSVLINTGVKPVFIDGLLSNVLYSTETERNFMVEGTINACNSLFYQLETELNIPHQEMRWQARCATTKTDGVYIPGFMGLAAPYWEDRLPNIKRGLDNASADEIIRAAMESIGFLAYDIYSRINKHLKINIKNVTASGGGSRPPLLQFLADILRISVGHTPMKDQTALGVYKLLRQDQGDEIEVQAMKCDQVFHPTMTDDNWKTKIERWHQALEEIGVL